MPKIFLNNLSIDINYLDTQIIIKLFNLIHSTCIIIYYLTIYTMYIVLVYT